MKKIMIILLFGLLVIQLSGCDKEIVYHNNYNLQDVELFRIHQNDMYPLFMVNGEIYLLDSSEENQFDARVSTRVALLFQNHASDEEFDELEFRNITNEIPLSENEEIIEIIDYFEGWLFLTNLGNVIKYEIVPDPTMAVEFYVEGEESLIPLEEDEQIIDMYYRDGFQMDVLRFETSQGRFFDVEEDNLNSIFGYELYDDAIFNEGEHDLITFLDWTNNAYFIVTSDERVLRYNIETKEVSDETSNFPLEDGEKIVAFNYESSFRRIYVTSTGRAVGFNPLDYTVYNEFTLGIELEEEENITEYQRGFYGCREGMALIRTNQDRLFLIPSVDSPGFLFEPNDLPLGGDAITSIELSIFSTNVCGSTSSIMYNGSEIKDFQYMLTIQTEQNHLYLVGFLSDYNKSDFDTDFLVLQIK